MKRVAIAGIAAVLVLIVGAVFFLTQPTSSACGYPAPVNANLPSILKSIGGFDQPHDPSDVADLQSTAVSAATATYAELIGVSAQSPVHETPLHGGPSATVVPLTRGLQDYNHVVALVAYLSDCSGRVYFDKVDYLTSGAIAAFPVVSQQEAAAKLGTQTPQLQYSSDPFHPVWTSNGHQEQAS
jgi:hypothetical protein